MRSQVPSKLQKHNESVILFGTFVLALIASLGTNMYLPALPEVGQTFSVSSAFVQLTISCYLIGAAGAQLIFGPLSDVVGRRPVILSGIVIFLAGSLLCATAASFPIFMIGRLIQGIGASATSSLARVILKDTFSGNALSRASTYNGIGLALGISIAPLIGGALQTWFRWETTFIFMAFYAAISIVLLWSRFPETHHDRFCAWSLSTVFSSYRRAATDGHFLANALCASLALAGINIFYSVSPYFFQNNLGLTPLEYSMSSVFVTAALFIGRFINIPMLRWFQWRGALVCGNILMAISGLILLIFTRLFPINIVLIMGPVSLFTIGSGLVFSNSIVGALQHLGKIAGAAGALYGCTQMGLSALLNTICTRLEFNMALLLGMCFFIFGITGWIAISIPGRATRLVVGA